MVSADISTIDTFDQEAPAVKAAAGTNTGGGRVTVGDMFAVSAMVLVMATVGVGLMVQFGLGPLISAGVATAAFALLLAGHVGLRRVEAGNARPGEAVGKHRSMPTRASMPTKTPMPVSPVDQTKKNAKPNEPGGASKRSTADECDVGKSDSAPKNPELAKSEQIKHADLGSVRPRPAPDLNSTSHRDADNQSRADDGENAPDIDALIKRLADDIESGRKTEPAPQVGADGAGLIAAAGASEMAPPPVPQFDDTATADRATDLSAISAIDTPKHEVASAKNDKTAVGKPMLGSSHVSVPTAPVSTASGPSVKPAPPKPSPMSMVQAASQVMEPAAGQSPRTTTPAAKLAAIADALSDEQMDVYLETINGLEDYRAQHYEVSVRLRLADGEVLANDTFITEARGTGLLPLLEAVKVSSTKRLAVQMMQRGRSGEFFTAVDGEALADAQFGDDVDTIAGGDQVLAQRLVLAFSQADVRGLTKAQNDTLSAIAALGFKFSIEDITDLDMDFEALVARGFAFAKLDADVFLNGLPTGQTRVPPTDICQHLAKAGLTLIVGKVSNETARAKILGFGGILGQGSLFGAPRPVRASVLRPTAPSSQEPAAV